MEQVKKIWSIICKILNAFFLVLLVGLVVVLLYLAIGSKGNGLPFLQNYQLFTVLSGSMEPTLNVGGVIIVEKVDPMTLEEGDIITFVSNDTTLNGKVVSHRILQVVDNNNGRMFITKGDANEDRDDAAAYLGYLLNFMKTKNGFFLILLLPCMIILLVETISLLKNFWAYVDEKKALKEGKVEDGSEEEPELPEKSEQPEEKQQAGPEKSTGIETGESASGPNAVQSSNEDAGEEMLLAADKQNTTDEQFAEDLLQSDNETENKPTSCT